MELFSFNACREIFFYIIDMQSFSDCVKMATNSVQTHPHYVRPRKLDNKVKFKFDPDEVINQSYLVHTYN